MICRSMNRIIRVCVLTAVLLTACQSQAGGDLSMDEHTVYSAVVRSRPPYPIVINTTIDTFGEVSSGELPELISGIRSDTIADWIARNQEPVVLPQNLSFEKGYEVIPQSELEPLARYYFFTRVGFSKDGQQAFLRFYFACPLCGEGAFYLLEKKEGVWEIVHESEKWKT